jgi:DNA-binding NarL/FixJ family response regulator
MNVYRKIRVGIVDDHEVTAVGLKTLLSQEADIETKILPFESEDRLLAQLRQSQQDVLLLDARMPGFDLLTALDKILALQIKIIIVTSLDDPNLVRAAVAKNVAGYLQKSETLSRLLPLAIRSVFTGKKWFSPGATEQLLQEMTGSGIVFQEYLLNVLRLMAKGQSPDEIAARLGRTKAAIYSAQRLIREKLGVSSNEQAVVTAIRQKIIPLSDIAE